ncbi:MAG: DNA methyltransferase, partial [Bradyrhizobium sp.]
MNLVIATWINRDRSSLRQPDAISPLPVCEQGGRIIDPFAGSGTTLLAAQLEGYSWVGCEMIQHYAGIARERLAKCVS